MDILTEKYVIISVMGTHAGEPADEIFSRKIKDVQTAGRTLWVIRSHKANPNIVCSLCNEGKRENRNVYCIFIEPSTKLGARPTRSATRARFFSKDKIRWESFPSNLSPVTGKIDTNSYALVFDDLRLMDSQTNLNLWNYAEFENHNQPIILKLGVSTICAISKDMSGHPQRIKANIRRIIAMGKLAEPCCVWLK